MPVADFSIGVDILDNAINHPDVGFTLAADIGLLAFWNHGVTTNIALIDTHNGFNLTASDIVLFNG